MGSKEGWTPKTFVSSRSNRNKDKKDATTQRPEDFMDEEDLAEAAESRTLETAQAFAAVGGPSGSGTAQDDFFGLFMTEEDTMGVKILQKMGWRRDQGVGHKVRRPVDSDMSAQHLFAPPDTSMMPIIAQEQRKGLGFQSEARLSKAEEDAEPSTSMFDRLSKAPAAVKKPSVKKSSFGVGVLNDTGSDDEDPYELGPKITFNRTIGKEKKAKKPSKFAKAGASEKIVFMPKKAASKTSSALALQAPDGRLPLRGFVFAIIVVEQSRKRFPPPKIPPGWKSSKGISSSGAVDANFQSVADAAKASTLDAATRASLLGEKPLPGKSVFDFLSKEARDRIAGITGRTDLPQGRGEAAPDGFKSEGPKNLWTFVPALDKEIAAAALAKGATGWMPYAEDLKKRARYVGFLELRAGLRQDLPERAPETSIGDWAKELEEFAHAANVFKPTSGIMASRFTSSSASSQGGTKNNSGENSNLLRTAAVKAEDPAEQAAKMGMYGPMTRTQFAFYPSRLLCKRFNVPPPKDVPPSADPGEEGNRTHEPVSKPDMDKMVHEYLTKGNALHQRPAWMTAPAGTASATSQPAPVAVMPEHATVDVEKNEALDKERAPEDVFKSIFGDDDED